jgi:hypothetical protein
MEPKEQLQPHEERSIVKTLLLAYSKMKEGQIWCVPVVHSVRRSPYDFILPGT